jgi:hypothetical protein
MPQVTTCQKAAIIREMSINELIIKSSVTQHGIWLWCRFPRALPWPYTIRMSIFTTHNAFFFFFSTEAWTQGLYLEPLHQPCFCEGFFETGSCRTICPCWLWTLVLLISASWVTRITGVSHQPLAPCIILIHAKVWALQVWKHLDVWNKTWKVYW